MTLNLHGSVLQAEAQAGHQPSNDSQPLVTVITPCLNSIETIGETLLSVLAAQVVLQKHQLKLEHIVVDGGSTDGTTDFLASHVARFGFCRWMANVSGGPYAAMNMGLRQANGCYAHILNSDDLLLDPESYAAFLHAGHRQNASVLLASIGYFRRPSRHIRSLWLVDPIPDNAREWRRRLTLGLHYPHPGFIANSNKYKQYFFDQRYGLSADYKLMQSILLALTPKDLPMICQHPLVAMAEGGATGSWKAILEGWQQLNAINRELGIQGSSLRRYWSKLKQRLRPLPEPILIPHLEPPGS